MKKGRTTTRGSNSSTPRSGGWLQGKAANAGDPTHLPPIVHDVLKTSGQPLTEQTRALMEPRFGRDFSRVRVHTDARVGGTIPSPKKRKKRE